VLPAFFSQLLSAAGSSKPLKITLAALLRPLPVGPIFFSFFSYIALPPFSTRLHRFVEKAKGLRWSNYAPPFCSPGNSPSAKSDWRDGEPLEAAELPDP
jgi:hypothetical protein